MSTRTINWRFSCVIVGEAAPLAILPEGSGRRLTPFTTPAKRDASAQLNFFAHRGKPGVYSDTPDTASLRPSAARALRTRSPARWRQPWKPNR